MSYIALRAADTTALAAITSPAGVLALLADGSVYVQNDAPTGDNWLPVSSSGGGLSEAEVLGRLCAAGMF